MNIKRQDFIDLVGFAVSQRREFEKHFLNNKPSDILMKYIAILRVAKSNEIINIEDRKID